MPKFRAHFNETTWTARQCEELVVNAIDAARGVELAEQPRTLESGYGDVHNTTVDVTVTVDETADDRSAKGRLNATLMGDNACDGLTTIES
jgi:hypothetical protein